MSGQKLPSRPQSHTWAVTGQHSSLPLSFPRLHLPLGRRGKEKIRGRLDLSGASGTAYGSG